MLRVVLTRTGRPRRSARCWACSGFATVSTTTQGVLSADAAQQQCANRRVDLAQVAGPGGQDPMGHDLVDRAEPRGGGGGGIDWLDGAGGDGIVEVTADQVGERGA